MKRPLVLRIWEEGGGTVETMRFDDERVVVGRIATSDIVIPRGYCAKRHCQIRREGEFWVVEDLNSSGGTYVEGERVLQARPLKPGEAIEICDVRIVRVNENETDRGARIDTGQQTRTVE